MWDWKDEVPNYFVKRPTSNCLHYNKMVDIALFLGEMVDIVLMMTYSAGIFRPSEQCTRKY
jgi:hypothetical protein